MQVRVSPTEAQVVGATTDEVEYAVTELPEAMLPPQGSVQGAVGVTLTVTDETGEVPVGPVHWKLKVVSAVIGLVKPLPESVPELDHGPVAVQEVALDDDHARVVLWPE